MLCYSNLTRYDVISYYKLHAISKAAGILSNRKQSIKRARVTKNPYLRKLIITSCYGFKIEDGVLKVPHGDRKYFDIVLNKYSKEILSDNAVTVRSFTLTANNTVSICYSKIADENNCTSIAGIDRNLRNLTVGNENGVVQYDLSKTVDIAENTRSITKSFKRNDLRIRKKIYSKYGMRKKNRVNQILHHVSKRVVQKAKEVKSAIAFEDIRHIRKLYRKGNYQGKNYRVMLNGWSFAAIKRQIEYKANWEGVPIIQLSVTQTRGTSQFCPRCGKRVQVDRLHKRELYCPQCDRWLDRDVVAAMNISKGAHEFVRSKGSFLPFIHISDYIK